MGSIAMVVTSWALGVLVAPKGPRKIATALDRLAGCEAVTRGDSLVPQPGRWLVTAILSTVTDSLPPCPECSSEYVYELGALLVCPECAHEWEAMPADGAQGPVIKDAVGNILTDGDTVIVTKNLKVKGNPTPIKVGTKVRNIRLGDGVDGHDIDCKVDGFGPMQLKSSVVKKVQDGAR
jgi:protein PhnA